MLASLLIVFREVLEAGLIVGIVLAATTGVPGRGRWVVLGIAGGLVGAGIVALFADSLSNSLSGIGHEAFTAGILLIAVAMLGWHNIWMARHAREMEGQISAVGRSVASGETSLLALAVVVGVAVLREGAEVVLFLYGIVAASNESALALGLGGALGVAAGGAVAYLLYRGLLVIPTRHLFGTTNWLIALLAAGMAGQAVAILARADVLPMWGSEVWDTSAILPDSSWLGLALRTLVGYSDRPPGIQVAAYLAVLALLIVLGRTLAPAPRQVSARPAR
jgi:high-affinity iron transporter